MTINQEDKDWIENAFERGFTRLQMKRKLEKSGYTEERIDEYLKYYDILTNKNPPEVMENDKDFEDSVKDFLTNDGKNLGFWEKRAVKKYLKEISKLSAVMKTTLVAMRKETEEIRKRFSDDKKVEKELEDLKAELVDRIIESKVILDIDDPITKEEATKENLMKNSLEDLMSLMELNIQDIEDITNGRVK